ncbi:unnamed protein product [Ixodes pacificus]
MAKLGGPEDGTNTCKTTQPRQLRHVAEGKGTGDILRKTKDGSPAFSSLATCKQQTCGSKGADQIRDRRQCSTYYKTLNCTPSVHGPTTRQLWERSSKRLRTPHASVTKRLGRRPI